MKLIGITRVRNEENIIENTLNHVQSFVGGIIVYDDCSNDSTVSVCEKHPAVLKVLKGKKWDSTTVGRNNAEGSLRQLAYLEAVKQGATWVYYFDADEYIEFVNIDFKSTSYYFRLFDFYITPEDVHKNYLNRDWMGPEYRDIPMLFKVQPLIKFHQRVPNGIGKPEFGGYVKHYGKAISVEEWEKACDYYANIRWAAAKYKDLQERWLNRKGRAIHIVSDFNRPLITWEQRFDKTEIVAI